MTFYKPFVTSSVQTLAKDVLVPLVVGEASTHYTFGLDIASWLSGATTLPAVPYLASVLISLGFRWFNIWSFDTSLT